MSVRSEGWITLPDAMLTYTNHVGIIRWWAKQYQDKSHSILSVHGVAQGRGK